MSDKREGQLVEELTQSTNIRLAEEASRIYKSHAALNSSNREIRLLTVQPNNDFNASLVGSLSLATLDNDYLALSYVWGSWLDRTPIILNDVPTTITANLAIALKRLRSERGATNLWIDAVCINPKG